MSIGVPKEIKTLEGRVALVPAAVGDLVHKGHEVLVQSDAGIASGYSDEQFVAAGARILPDAAALYEAADIVVKVKEPQPVELELLRKDQLLFSYLHLAAESELMQGLLALGITAVAFETVQAPDRSLPLLAPMSDIAGRIAIQVGTHLLHRPQGGKGILLGGLPAAPRGKVVVLGAGVAGGNAALMAAGLGAEVTVFDRNRPKLERMRALGANVTGLYPYPDTLAEAVAEADILVGAILVAGEKAVHLVSEDMVKAMQPGSVIIDISVDQGGCIETTRPTTYAEPTFLLHEVLHFGVTNMPGAVPRTASQALSASLLPYVHRIAHADWQQDGELQAGINVKDGIVVHPALKNL